MKSLNINQWKLAINEKQLMGDPHSERGATDWFIIETEMHPEIDWNSITQLRIYLYQESPLWQKYEISDIQCYHQLPKEYEMILANAK